ADRARHVQLVPQPLRHRRQERAQAARREGQVRLEQPVEVGQGLFVEDDRVEVARRQAGAAQAEVGGAGREGGVVLAAREALFLGGGDDTAAHHQGRGAVVVERGQTEEGCHDGGSDFLAGTRTVLGGWRV